MIITENFDYIIESYNNVVEYFFGGQEENNLIENSSAVCVKDDFDFTLSQDNECKNEFATLELVENKKFDALTLDSLKADLSNWIQVGAQKIAENIVNEAFEQEHPLYSYSFTNPREGDIINGKKVHWELVEGERVLVSSGKEATDSNGYSGNTKVSQGTTEGHVLTTEEIPAHKHNVPWKAVKDSDLYTRIKAKGSNSYYSGFTAFSENWKNMNAISLDTDSIGSNEAHSHKLDLTRIELPLYKRIS